jgi:uncharacterized damage-inducible protein DinB
VTSIDVLLDAFERIRDSLHPAVNGLSVDELVYRPDAESNSIAWLVWHLTRIQDDHIAELDQQPQAWMDAGWAKRFALALDPADTGYGHDAEAVAKVTADAASLLGYYEEVHQKTLAFVGSRAESDLTRVVDERWDPPVTMGIRLVSVIVDDLQHVGQAAYVRGLLPQA